MIKVSLSISSAQIACANVMYYGNLSSTVYTACAWRKVSSKYEELFRFGTFDKNLAC